MSDFFNRKPTNFMPKYHYVRPHYVNSYVKKDGTFVHGYLRDGDGDTSVNRKLGYMSLNPGQKDILKK